MIIESNICPTVAGWYRLEAVKPDGSRRLVADWFPNLITDYGLNALGTNSISALTSYIHVGSGTAAPAVTDTGLQTWIASTSTLQDSSTAAQSTAPYYWRYRVTKRFGQGAAAGNLSEIGCSAQAANGNIFSRALILDGSGNPTTVTVKADESLDATYELRIYPPLTDGTWSVTDSGTTYSGTVRAAVVTSTFYASKDVSAGAGDTSGTINAYNGSIGGITGQPSGETLAVAGTNLAYSNNSLQRDFRGSYGLNEGNLTGGITAFKAFTAFGQFQFSVTPAINKTATKVLENVTFRCGPWARHTP